MTCPGGPSLGTVELFELKTAPQTSALSTTKDLICNCYVNWYNALVPSVSICQIGSRFRALWS